MEDLDVSQIHAAKLAAFEKSETYRHCGDMILSLLLLTATQTQPAAGVPEPPSKQPVGTARITFNADSEIERSVSGFADIRTARALTLDDPIRIASISKLVVAIGTLRLVEQGKLDLDRDVSDYLGWTLRNPNFPSTSITLRMILSHQSSLTDTVNYVLPLDAATKDVLAKPEPWDSTHAPGTWFAYTNFNTQIVALAMESVTGERLDRLMARLVLEPLNIDACYQYIGCTTATTHRAVTLYRDGQPTKDAAQATNPECPVTPATNGDCDPDSYWRVGRNGAIFAPQGGLRISAANLAKIGRLLLGNGTLDGVRILSPQSIKLLETPQWRFNGNSGQGQAHNNGDSEGGFHCAYGLSTMFLATGGATCRDDPFGDGKLRFGHSGSAYGLKSGLWIDRASGTGVAYFINDVPAEAGAHSAFTAAEERIARGKP